MRQSSRSLLLPPINAIRPRGPSADGREDRDAIDVRYEDGKETRQTYQPGPDGKDMKTMEIVYEWIAFTVTYSIAHGL